MVMSHPLLRKKMFTEEEKMNRKRKIGFWKKSSDARRFVE